MTTNLSAQFAPFAERMRLAGLPQIAIDNFRYYYGLLLEGSSGSIAEAEIEPVAEVQHHADLEAYASAGQQALGQAVVLKLNGGLGTSMGLERAKSLLTVRDGLTFLDIIARQVRSFDQRYGCRVPLLLMNSFNTDADTRALLERYPELRSALPQTMLQNKVPKVLQATLTPAEWPADPDLEWCPPGHGEIYSVLVISGLLEQLLAGGYRYLFISNADNLGATLDLAILGYMAQHNPPFMMEVTERTEADKKGGHIARLKNGQLILREIAQCPEPDLAAFQDILRHRFFNTNNIWINLPRLKQLLDASNNVVKLPMIRNSKTLDPKDSASPAVYQLETAMGAAIGIFEGAQVLAVGRERFLPVKTCADLLALRSDIYTLDADYTLRANPARTHKPIVLELDTRFYRLIDDFEQRFAAGAPGLLDCARLTVRGDVAFGSAVTLKGEVVIVNAAPEQRRLPDGTLVDDGTHELT